MISDEAIKAATAKVVLESLTPEHKDELLQDAIKYLLTPKKDQYNRNKPETSPLSDLFQTEVIKITREMVHEELVNNQEFQAKLKEVVVAGTITALTDDESMNALSKKMTEVLGMWFSGQLERDYR